MRHRFVDGNKRTALASALTFLYLNGYEVEESYDLELADLVF
ncbi:MAG: type II toxin-antitoxin system death-on-curing family toxin [Bacteroidetes bacterium]|nr:type II toxin-antitoxin system death-on-curing family toxin [Bacteroidota bacterium]